MIRRAGPHDATSFEDAWTSGDHTRLEGETADLIRTAELLARSAAAEPSAQFRTDLRSRLMTLAPDALVAQPAAAIPEPAPAPRTSPVRRRLAGLTAAAVAAVGTVGMISTSATAVPGDVLYPIKQGVESVQLSLHRSDESRGEFQLDQARERLAEAAYLDSHDQDDRVADVLETFSDQAAAGSSRLFTAYDTDRAPETIDTVTDFAAAATVSLAGLSDDLPADAQVALDAAAQTITGLASRASVVCITCSPADLSSLLDAVDQAVRDLPAGATGPSESGSDPTPAGSSKPPATTAPPQTPAPGATTPAPSVTSTPSLKDLTDPLIGGLLGDEEQEGLVPSLLDGLLGPPKN